MKIWKIAKYTDYDWSRVNWEKNNTIISEQTGAPLNIVQYVRRIKSPDEYYDLRQRDWSKSDEEIAQETGWSLRRVKTLRTMYALTYETGKPYDKDEGKPMSGYDPRGQGQWNTQLDKLFGLAQVNEDLEKPVLFWERYDGVRKGRTLVEIFKNPDNLTIRRIRRSQGYGYEIAVLVTKNNTYAFRRDLELHRNVARKLGLSEYVGVLLGEGYAMITDATVESLRHTKEAARMVREAFPDIIEISYFDEAIVGDWEEIEGYENMENK